MPIKHVKTAGADDGSAEVNANEWNADHTMPSHGEVSGITPDQHHAQTHYSAHARSGADGIVRTGVVVDPAGKGDHTTIQAAIDSLS